MENELDKRPLCDRLGMHLPDLGKGTYICKICKQDIKDYLKVIIIQSDGKRIK
jgi:tRNA(Ile2) C34 agmatinyltransferase TiaS